MTATAEEKETESGDQSDGFKNRDNLEDKTVDEPMVYTRSLLPSEPGAPKSRSPRWWTLFPHSLKEHQRILVLLHYCIFFYLDLVAFFNLLKEERVFFPGDGLWGLKNLFGFKVYGREIGRRSIRCILEIPMKSGYAFSRVNRQTSIRAWEYPRSFFL